MIVVWHLHLYPSLLFGRRSATIRPPLGHWLPLSSQSPAPFGHHSLVFCLATIQPLFSRCRPAFAWPLFGQSLLFDRYSRKRRWWWLWWWWWWWWWGVLMGVGRRSRGKHDYGFDELMNFILQFFLLWFLFYKHMFLLLFCLFFFLLVIIFSFSSSS